MYEEIVDCASPDLACRWLTQDPDLVPVGDRLPLRELAVGVP